MHTTRREVLLQGGVIAAGIVGGHWSGVAALAQSQPPRRRSLEGLAWNDPVLSTYRDAVGIMKQKPDNDPFSWASLARIHGTDPSHYQFCPHGNWYFLPWHRGYVAMYERIVRHLTGNNDFAMPYWDWTAEPLMPKVFLSPKTPDGKPNWLDVTDANWQRTWDPTEPMPSEIVGRTVLTKILGETPYESFGTSRPRGQNSLDARWITTRTGVQGALEGTAHNNVHNNIGGWMPTASSPRDPVFFMHHSNIDRIWATWNLQHANSTDPLWTGMTFKDNFRNVDGSSWSPKVSELFVPEELDYTYGLGSLVTASTAPSANLMALNSKLRSLFALPEIKDESTDGTLTVSVANAVSATAATPLQVTIKVPEASLASVAQRETLGSGAEMMNMTAALNASASGTRVLAFIRDVAVTDPETTLYRVFLDRAELSSTTPISDPHYVGSFGIFNHGMGAEHDAHGEAPSFALDLTDTLRRIQGSGEASAGEINLQILPVSNTGRNKPGTATPARIEVAFVST